MSGEDTGQEPGGLPASGSVPVRYIQQVQLYAIELGESVFPDARVWVVVATDPDGKPMVGIDYGQAGTAVHEAVERWSTTHGEEQAAEAFRREWLNSPVMETTTIDCAFCGDPLKVPPHGNREDAMRPHLSKCRELAG
jgi:hypothetical protein